MKISVVGTGYVGMSIVTLLAQHNETIAANTLRGTSSREIKIRRKSYFIHL